MNSTVFLILQCMVWISVSRLFAEKKDGRKSSVCCLALIVLYAILLRKPLSLLTYSNMYWLGMSLCTIWCTVKWQNGLHAVESFSSYIRFVAITSLELLLLHQ